MTKPHLPRRTLLELSLAAGGGTLLAPWLGGCAGTRGGGDGGPRLGFKAIPPSMADTVTLAEGYRFDVLAPWGEPVGITGQMPAWKRDASNTAAEQALQMGMHHDGMQFYALNDDATRAVLAINNEYTDDGLLHPDGLEPWTAEKVAKSQAAHGIAVIEIELRGGRWQHVRPSPYARRITAQTPHAVSGPAAGHVLMRTAADPSGRRILGTFANCGCGRTPWGTFLSGEENWPGYFDSGSYATADQRRYGAIRESWYHWAAHDARFDPRKHPNEFHRFGWIVELDPLDPASTPIKRTALGRGMHEGAWVATTKDGLAVVYTGEDAAFEYLFKFVSRDRIAPGGAKANRELLDHGTLYVARFHADGSGMWLPLVHGQGPLVPANGFADTGEVAIKARQAADLLGATKMDRPEWIAIDQASGEVYCALTNNEQRGVGTHPGPDAVNPRSNNSMGHILRWKDEGDFDGTRLRWSLLLQAGDPANARPEARGDIRGDVFSSPDTITWDPRGVLWICTDVSQNRLNQGEMARMGNNQLLACDVASGEVRRFLVGPVGCELTGTTLAPDGRTLFVNIQHPGETASSRSDPAQPQRYSSWPDGPGGGRPRSATLAIRRIDGGIVGT